MLIKRVCGNRRVALCWRFEETGLVVMDPALDPSMDVKAYMDSLFDPVHVKVREGEQPTWFTLRTIPRPLYLARDGGTSRGDADWVIRSCLRELENYGMEDEAGQVSALKIEFAKWSDKLDLVSEDTMDKLRLDDLERVALMLMARHMTEAGRGPLAKRSGKPSGLTE